MKFLADMGISPHTVSFLRDLGYEATHLHGENLDRMADPDILDKARREGYVLLTHDLDFGQLLAVSGADMPTVITFRLRDMTPNNVNRHLAEIIHRHSDLLARGAIVTVMERHIRARSLPIANR
jgi:predicted nuclease of predicted toxin-antitoxin system